MVERPERDESGALREEFDGDVSDLVPVDPDVVSGDLYSLFAADEAVGLEADAELEEAGGREFNLDAIGADRAVIEETPDLGNTLPLEDLLPFADFEEVE